MEKLLKSLITQFERIDRLVNNAGIPAMLCWRESVFGAFRDPRGVITFNPKIASTRVRDAYTVLHYDQAFRTGLCEYGLIRGQKED